ncbi:MAG: tRNA (cytidine(34)-2'-O)-methyltransferase [Micrococcaceae bacterium]
MFNIVFHEPEIPGNSGSTIRLSAVTGAKLHLIEPLGFDMDEKKVRRAGLDYHDMAHLSIHHNFDDFLKQYPQQTVYAFSGSGTSLYSDIHYKPGDVLLFGKESDGLAPEIMNHPRVKEVVRIPMTEGSRSLNLASSAALVTYEAWRQNNFAGSLDHGTDSIEPFIYPHQH